LLDISAFGYKVRQYLTVTSIPYVRVDLPLNPPRSELLQLGIQYGRVPVLAIGKDIYCDSSLQLAALQATFVNQALPAPLNEDAYRAWGIEMRSRAVAVVPVHKFPPEMIADRAKFMRMLNSKMQIGD
jgi:hypothetical protein